MTTSSGSAGYSICLMRHGIAEELGSGGAEDDASRRLTGKGRKRILKIAGGLCRIGLAFDWIVSSPLARAAETAQLVADSLLERVPSDVCDALRPGGRLDDLKTFLARQPSRRRVLLIGHEPDLSILAARLIGAGRQANLSLKKGGCCLIQCDSAPFEAGGRLVWWLTPRLLRKLGGD